MIKVCGRNIQIFAVAQRSSCHSCQQLQRQIIFLTKMPMLLDFGSYQSLSWSTFKVVCQCQRWGAAAWQVDAEQTFGREKAAYLAVFMATTAVERATVQLSVISCLLLRGGADYLVSCLGTKHLCHLSWEKMLARRLLITTNGVIRLIILTIVFLLYSRRGAHLRRSGISQNPIAL